MTIRDKIAFVAHTRSAKKRIRQAEKRTLRNRSWISRVRTAARRVREAKASGDEERLREALRRAFSVIDKAQEKGIIHRNAAARRKSRLSKLAQG